MLLRGFTSGFICSDFHSIRLPLSSSLATDASSLELAHRSPAVAILPPSRSSHRHPKQIPQPDLTDVIDDILIVQQIGTFLGIPRLRTDDVRHLDTLQILVHTPCIHPRLRRHRPHTPRRKKTLLLRNRSCIRVGVGQLQLRRTEFGFTEKEEARSATGVRIAVVG
jgi:hypothetical protein